MNELLLPFFKTFLNAILIAFLGYLVAFIVYQVMQRLLEKPLGKQWAVFLARLSWLAVIIVAVKILLDQTGATGLVVVLATAVTGALAIGSEGLAADLVAGLILFFTKPFEVDDYVLIGDYEGTVVGVKTTAVALDCYDGSRIILRNSVVLDNTVINYSANKALRLEVNVPVPLSADQEKVVETLMACIATFEPQVRDESMPPHVVLDSTNSVYAEYQIRFYIPSTEYFGVMRMRMFQHAARALKEAGLTGHA